MVASGSTIFFLHDNEEKGIINPPLKHGVSQGLNSGEDDDDDDYDGDNDEDDDDLDDPATSQAWCPSRPQQWRGRPGRRGGILEPGPQLQDWLPQPKYNESML